MSDKMTAIAFGDLIDWMFQEHASEKSIFGIPQSKFYKRNNDARITLFEEEMETPVGPAAGPNTQLAQNIAASYLGGSRFFELKTVQILDELEFPKPCIKAEDECYNTEWSTELSITGAFEEYVKGWFLLYVLEKEFGFADQKSFMFNMSVGYDLEGIKSEKVDAYIEGMRDASSTEIFQDCKQALADRLDQFENIDQSFIDSISPNICNSITLSTMHGCPPDEIEAICKYLIGEKKIHTFLKMNPTLLGYDYVRSTFDEMGYDYISLKEESFTHDLQYEDGIAMLKRLRVLAKEHSREFGVKLSNTLPVQITRSELPGEEMYMSGRSLYPLTINLAYKLASEFGGDLQISFSGGADAFNIQDIYETGIRPITVATTILKPGGYMRLKQMAEIFPVIESSQGIDLAKLGVLAENAKKDINHVKDRRTTDSRKTDLELPLLDCFMAPCTVGCPIEQDIPQYLQLVSEKRYDEAFRVITAKNPLPGITGTICDHQCMFKCTRLDYDASLHIREMKKVAFDNAASAYTDALAAASAKCKARAVVVGAGPAGMSFAWFLKRNGMDVTVLDARQKPGGTVTHIIPEFRIPQTTIDADYEMIRKAGVDFQFGVDPDFSVDELKKEYDYVFLGIGATKENTIRVESDRDVLNAVKFLEDYKEEKVGNLGRHVVVAGAGNTAMDTARAAKRIPGVETVSIVYRRTKAQMPADREELEFAAGDGVLFKELLNPVSLKQGKLTCEIMELGEPDESGRRRPVGTGQTTEVDCDTLISSIGEKIDTAVLEKNGIGLDADGYPALNDANMTSVKNVYLGGDARKGPSTVVKAIADATLAARDVLAREGLELDLSIEDIEQGAEAIWAKKGVLVDQLMTEQEGDRCLSCHTICEICMEVCPNRANVTVEIDGRKQILHVDGMCNECGNCEVFCPYAGAPYKEKFTLFWSEKDFEDSENPGFVMLRDGQNPKFKLRLNTISVIEFDKNGKCDDGNLDPAVASFVYQSFKDYNWMFVQA